MRIYDFLTHNERSQLIKLSSGINRGRERKTRSRANTERLNDRDIKELMGVNRQTYTRRNGAVRSK